MKLFGKKVPLTAVLATLALIGTVFGITVWHLVQMTYITPAGLEKPYIEPMTIDITGLPLGDFIERNVTIFNPNDVPVLVNSVWKVYVDGELIATGYPFADTEIITKFIWCRHISTTPADEYGIIESWITPETAPENESYPLVVPANGNSAYTFVYHLPLSYENSEGDWIDISENSNIQVNWEPKVTSYPEAQYGFYDGYEEWDNLFVPDWYK